MKSLWIIKLLMRFFPRLCLHLLASQQNIDDHKLDWAFKLFGGARIDFFPLDSSDHRGFLLILDQKLSLWFYQDGDHFVFDGYEIGEYEAGRVTILDGTKPVDFLKG